ncbi:MAG TPA: hypothetical protein VJ801_13100, partial [Polyangia bacterium]|nr:hypothetical protein [Polyangia bacterium]
ESELVARAGADMPLSKKASNSKKILTDGDLSQLFGLDIDAAATPARRRVPVRTRKPKVKLKPKAKRVSRRRKRKKH